jgi:hypothetical protein
MYGEFGFLSGNTFIGLSTSICTLVLLGDGLT